MISAGPPRHGRAAARPVRWPWQIEPSQGRRSYEKGGKAQGKQPAGRGKFVSMVMLASIVLWLAGCGGGAPAAHKAAALPSAAAVSSVAAAARWPPQCGTVMAAVRNVAREARIDLATGSMHASVTLSMLANWGSELGKAILAVKWKPPSPAGAALEVHVRNAVTAALRVTESQADAVRFIVSLQKIVDDCGQS
jgi:hypothetical protein